MKRACVRHPVSALEKGRGLVRWLTLRFQSPRPFGHALPVRRFQTIASTTSRWSRHQPRRFRPPVREYGSIRAQLLLVFLQRRLGGLPGILGFALFRIHNADLSRIAFFADCPPPV